MFKSISFSLILTLHLLLWTSLGALECRPEGPVVPAPRNLANSNVFQQAASNLSTLLDRAVYGEIRAGWQVENVSFSVGLVSLFQTDPGIPIWEYHHLSAANVNGTKHADRDSQYLIGSISKVFSDAILLRSGIDIDDPITQYIPQLNNASSLISWNNITLRALASQLSGIPPNYGFSEYYYIKQYFEYLGFPHVDDSAFAPCGVIGLNSGCTKEQFLEGMTQLYPVAPPMERPVYSNIAFTLFVYAIEAVTGKNYTAQLKDYITQPFGLTSTTVSPGIDARAVIPPVSNTWGSDYGDAAPGGGLVSTLSDLSLFLTSILNLTLLPTPTQVHQWLQPHSLAGSPYSLVGTPWEIFQPPPSGPLSLTPAHPHTIPIYAKGGAAYGYRSQLAVIPQYGIGVVVLTAGDAQAVTAIYDAVLAVLVPAVDEAARGEVVDDGIVGKFVSGAGGGDYAEAGVPGQTNLSTVGGVPFNMTTSLDGDSVLITGLTRNGSDILAGITEIWAATVGMVLPGFTGTFRLFPTEISTPGESGGRDVVFEDWRIWWSIELSGESDLPGVGLGAIDCLNWSLADWLYYGSEPIDRVRFVRDGESGVVLGVEVPFLRSGVLERVG